MTYTISRIPLIFPFRSLSMSSKTNGLAFTIQYTEADWKLCGPFSQFTLIFRLIFKTVLFCHLIKKKIRLTSELYVVEFIHFYAWFFLYLFFCPLHIQTYNHTFVLLIINWPNSFISMTLPQWKCPCRGSLSLVVLKNLIFFSTKAYWNLRLFKVQ